MNADNLHRANILYRRLSNLRSIQAKIDNGDFMLEGDERDTRLERLASMFYDDDLDLDVVCDFILTMIKPRIEATLAEVATL